MLAQGHSGSCVSLATYFFGYEQKDIARVFLSSALPQMHVVTLPSATYCDPSNVLARANILSPYLVYLEYESLQGSCVMFGK